MATVPTRRDALAAARETLAAAGIDSAQADAEWLLAGILGVGRATLHLDPGLTTGAVSRYERAVRRRAQREPLQRILGWEEFHGLRFCLTDAVLVPRPETEVLVDWTCALLPPPAPGRRVTAVDVGTGSGCVACALARRRHDIHVIAWMCRSRRWRWPGQCRQPRRGPARPRRHRRPPGGRAAGLGRPDRLESSVSPHGDPSFPATRGQGPRARVWPWMVVPTDSA